MINEFINIVYRSTRFDKNFYSNSKNFDEAAIYFAAIIVIVVGILGIIPQAAMLEFYRNNFIRLISTNYVSHGATSKFSIERNIYKKK